MKIVISGDNSSVGFVFDNHITSKVYELTRIKISFLYSCMIECTCTRILLLHSPFMHFYIYIIKWYYNDNIEYYSWILCVISNGKWLFGWRDSLNMHRSVSVVYSSIRFCPIHRNKFWKIKTKFQLEWYCQFHR